MDGLSRLEPAYRADGRAAISYVPLSRLTKTRGGSGGVSCIDMDGRRRCDLGDGPIGVWP